MVNPLYLLTQLFLVLFAGCLYFLIRKKYLISCLLGIIFVIGVAFALNQIILPFSLEKYCQKGYFSVKKCPNKIVLTYLPMEGNISWNCYTKWGFRFGYNCPIDDCSKAPEICQEEK